MRYIEPHAHMVSRTTDDYISMVWSCVMTRTNSISTLNGSFKQTRCSAARFGW